MTIDEMIAKKKEYGFSCDYISQKSGVPFSTVQKVFSKVSPSPRRKTLEALWKFFDEADRTTAAASTQVKRGSYFDDTETEYSFVNEGDTAYGYVDGTSALKPTLHVEVDTGHYVSKQRIKANAKGDKTLRDYLALPEGVRVELIDGIFYDMAAPSSPHTYLASDIREIFKAYIKANNGECVSMAAPVDVQLDSDDKTVVQPDVMIICDRSKITKPRVVGAPDLVVEVLSPSNWSHDMVRKLKKYKKAGVKEYWIVNVEEQSVLVYEFAQSDFPTEYDFDDEVPVGIWDGKCKVNFRELYEDIEFML
ncbi:MAG: Uma2 family endonuclease [Lachnospiraceae bacterium]|nr:Uma2 family endonuclease [Lachnospiraceae bacterium]